jgi:hypothetical protein
MPKCLRNLDDGNVAQTVSLLCVPGWPSPLDHHRRNGLRWTVANSAQRQLELHRTAPLAMRICVRAVGASWTCGSPAGWRCRRWLGTKRLRSINRRLHRSRLFARGVLIRDAPLRVDAFVRGGCGRYLQDARDRCHSQAKPSTSVHALSQSAGFSVDPPTKRTLHSRVDPSECAAHQISLHRGARMKFMPLALLALTVVLAGCETPTTQRVDFHLELIH